MYAITLLMSDGEPFDTFYGLSEDEAVAVIVGCEDDGIKFVVHEDLLA